MNQEKALEPVRRGYYPVLDALRFILAFWVAVAHYRMIPLLGDPEAGRGLLHAIRHLWSTFVAGTPAVIVFFVISGFCIHLPFQGNAKIDVFRYYMRRYTRILIPVAGALIVYHFMGANLTFRGKGSILWNSPLWSLACEEIYYAMYPFLRWARNRIGWRQMLPISFVIGAGTAATHPHAYGWDAFGPFGTSIILLPVWLLGCYLAEQSAALREANRRGSIWLWRFLAWAGCWSAEMVHFKLHIRYTQTMLWFGILAYFWVREEIANGNVHSPNKYLVAAGAWSYSLYLMHWYGNTVVGYLAFANVGEIARWFLVVTADLVIAYLFYLAVERPSHKLARKFKVRRDTQPSDGIPEAAGVSST